jgi:hypothetical protein
MRFHITLPHTLTHFNARYNVRPGRASYFANGIAARIAAITVAHFATPIAAFSRSAAYGLVAASLIPATILTTTLATCVPVSASAYKTGEPPSPLTPAQGSSSRKTVIDVRTSPAVYLPGPSFRIEVYSTNPVTPGVPERLQEGIEQVLLMNDPRLSVAQTAADTSIACTITDLAVTSRLEIRTRPEYRRTGQIIVTDSETGYSRTEDQFEYVDVSYRVLVFEGRMSVKWEVTDVATGILLYSDRVDAGYTYEAGPDLGVGPIVGPSLSSVDLNIAYLKLADKAASFILAQLSSSVHSEIVALTSGKLKDASTLLESGRWSEALTLLSSMSAFKDPKDDAYRFYSIGVAQEALAYETQDPFEKKRLLEKAVDNYRRAAELKPSENMFWAPKDRAESALSQTSVVVAQVEILEQAKRLSSTATSPDQIAGGSTGLFRQTTSRTPSAPMLIDNQNVVQWVKSGRSSDYIIASIKHAPGTRFDLSQVEVLKLRRDGVNDSVLKAMAKAQEVPRPSVLGKVLMTAASLLWLVPFVVR